MGEGEVCVSLYVVLVCVRGQACMLSLVDLEVCHQFNLQMHYRWTGKVQECAAAEESASFHLAVASQRKSSNFTENTPEYLASPDGAFHTQSRAYTSCKQFDTI